MSTTRGKKQSVAWGGGEEQRIGQDHVEEVIVSLKGRRTQSNTAEIRQQKANPFKTVKWKFQYPGFLHQLKPLFSSLSPVNSFSYFF